MAKEKIKMLAFKLAIADIGKKEVLQALENKKVNDFEDGMQYYSALANKCDAIITQDAGAYYFSSIEVLDAEKFLQQYVLK